MEESLEAAKKLVTDEAVNAAVLADKGPDAKVLSWHIQDFTKYGDNFATIVTCIKVKALINGNEENLSYVTKLNPCREAVAWNQMTAPIFEHEIVFFTKIASHINNYLKDPLRIPTCYYSSMESGKEILINNDLRENGFKMTDKKQGMDFDHITLLVNELARMHAGGYLTIKESSHEKILSQYPIIKDDLFLQDEDHLGMKMFDGLMQNQINIILKILETFPDYEDVSKWINSWRHEWRSVFSKVILDVPDAFKVFTHGDCWNNNFIFR